MGIVIDKEDTEWNIICSDDLGHIIVERKKCRHWICGVFYDGEIHEVEEGCQFSIKNLIKWTATRTFGWMATNDGD